MRAARADVGAERHPDCRLLGNGFGIPGITVDTHVGRLARRFGWTTETELLTGPRTGSPTAAMTNS